MTSTFRISVSPKKRFLLVRRHYHVSVIALTVPGIALAMPGITLTVSGIALAVSGITLAVSGITLAVSGIVLTASGIALAVSGIVLTDSGIALAISANQPTIFYFLTQKWPIFPIGYRQPIVYSFKIKKND
jgi:hypothetical protein